MDNVSQTVISQYGTAPSINALIGAWNDAIDPASFLQHFYNVMWNIETASGFGLDNWGLILGVSRYLEIINAEEYLGFAGTANAPFNVAPFYIGGNTSDLFTLSDAQYRQLLLAKAQANISRCSIASLNVLAQAVFGGGAMYVLDLGAMAMAYVFAATPSTINLAIAQSSGVLPNPTGVSAVVRTALLSNAQLLASTSGSDIGFGSGFGTLTPSTDVHGHAVTQLYYTSTGGGTVVLTIGSGLASTYIHSLTLNGLSLSASAATFSGGNTWTWTGVAALAMTSGLTYTALIS